MGEHVRSVTPRKIRIRMKYDDNERIVFCLIEFGLRWGKTTFMFEIRLSTKQYILAFEVKLFQNLRHFFFVNDMTNITNLIIYTINIENCKY